MGKVIPVTVRDKIASAPKDALYICGNSDFVIQFDFDAEWSEHAVKTARFAYNGTHQDVIFEGTECPIPVLSNIHNFKVGAFAGNLKTTTAAYVSAKKSILCGSGTPDAPAPDVYSQIMSMIDEIKQNGVTSDQIEEALVKYLEENPIGGGVEINDTTPSTMTTYSSNKIDALLTEQKEAKADKLIGIEHAGKLLYVGSDGIAKPLMLGDGLEIVNGILRITGAVTPETKIIFEDTGGGTVTMSGAEFLQQVDGAVLISGATFADQGSGVVLVN